MRATLARLRTVESDVLVPGLANGTINAYTWDTSRRQQLMDHALAQLT